MSEVRRSAGRLTRLAGRREVPLAVALLSIVLALPALRVGLFGDDYVHRAILLGRSETGQRIVPVRDLFSFVSEATRPWMIDVGYLPWWADPNLRIALGRPLTALTHMADYALWPDAFAVQHLHSLLWCAAGVGLVALLYRKLFSATLVAAAAGVFFAVEDAHALPAGWLANRNALVCLVAGTGVILLHLAWRRHPTPWRLAAALAALAVGLGCGEATLGALAYVAAWQLTCEQSPWPRRLAPLIPYGVVVVVWRVAYQWLGFGTSGSTLYVDPGVQPLLFLEALLERWPVLLLGQWLEVPIDLWLMLPRTAQIATSAVGIAATAGLMAVVWGLLKRERLARFWALGMGLSLVPLCAAFPMDRLLVFSGIGAFGLLAMLLESMGVWPWLPGSGAAAFGRRFAWLLLILHGPLAAARLPLRVALLPWFGKTFSVAAERGPDGPEVAGQTFVFVNGNDFPVVYGRIIRQIEGLGTPPRRVAQLSSVSTPNTVRREDSRTLVIHPVGGFLSFSLDRLLASPTRTFQVSERVERPDFVAEVRSVTSDSRPEEVAFRFRRPLEDPALRWLYWKDGNLIEFPLPGVGESVTLRESLLVQ